MSLFPGAFGDQLGNRRKENVPRNSNPSSLEGRLGALAPRIGPLAGGSCDHELVDYEDVCFGVWRLWVVSSLVVEDAP